MLGWSSKAIEWLNPEQPPPTTEIRSPLGAGSWELMISFTLPIAFSVICTMLFIYSWIVGKSLVPLYRRDRITPTFNHLDDALWDSVAEKSTLNSAGGAKSESGDGDRQDCQRISGKRRRKSMALLSVPGVLSCKVYPLKPGRGSTRR